MRDEIRCRYATIFIKCAVGATDLPSSGRGWPVGPGDGQLFVRKNSSIQTAGEARALHGVSHSPCVPVVLELLFACTSADYNMIVA